MSSTPTEGHLAELGARTSLSLWCYPSPFRDQGNASGGDGKEIADLLIVFDKTIVIFSDKACDYPSHENDLVRWKRWFRASILGCAQQLKGAMRWLKSHPGRVYADRACSQQLAVDLEGVSDFEFHLVAVVHDKTGVRARLAGGSGALLLDSRVVGGQKPFHVGLIDTGFPVVHVWDESVFHKVLRHMDTAPDLIRYLRQRHTLLESGSLVGSAREDDLLAVYMTQVEESGSHYLLRDGQQEFSVREGAWRQFVLSIAYRSWSSASESSRLWDSLIDKTIGHCRNGTSLFDTSEGDVRQLERAFRCMASENRMARRGLVSALVDCVSTAEDRDLFRTIPWKDGAAASYVFYSCPRWKGELEDAYRERRHGVLQLRMEWSLAYGLVDAKRPVIGIAVDAGAHLKGAHYSEDLMFMELDEIEAEWRQDKLAVGVKVGWGSKFKRLAIRTPEYPIASVAPARKKVGRNQPCPCGSERKFKKCCGLGIA